MRAADQGSSSKRHERIALPELSGELLEHILSHIEDDDRVLAAACALNKHWRDLYLKKGDERRVRDMLMLRAILGALRRCTDRNFTMYHVVTAVHNVAPDLESNAISVRELLRDVSRQVPLSQVLDAMPEDVQCAAWRMMVSYDSLLLMSLPIECLDVVRHLGLLDDDDVLAVRLNRLAADHGDAASQNNIGAFYATGRGGLDRDEVEAVCWYRLAADQDYPTAQFNLALYYEKGRGGLSRDESEAARLYRLAADKGITLAHYDLARFYEQGRGGLSQDDAEAVRHFRLAADGGFAEANFYLGGMHAFGRGGLSKDETEATRLYRLAADKGALVAQRFLAQLYEQGECGLDKDDAEAARLYQLAADQGDSFARRQLGLFYEQGRGGLGPDDAEAVRFYRLAHAHADLIRMGQRPWADDSD